MDRCSSRCGSDELPESAVYRLLSREYRRHLLSCLDRHAEPLALADAAESVACDSEDRPITDISAEVVKEVYMSLYHNHIPKLAEADVVAYDQERDLVTLTKSGERLLDGYRHLLSERSE